ncbi:MAG: hypothetical protein KatS3mg129_0417 [Leptospiraceae bacterium]|nr:MAG: hypothetical protein KatS3mg129_0417 [Leptospiraceae bacterium]
MLFLGIYILLNLYLENYLPIQYNTEQLQNCLGIATCLPDNCFCEKVYTNQIAQPINSFTNIFYLYTGILILFQLKKWDLFSIIYSYIVILLSIGSFFYHATMTFFGMWLDVFSMYMYILFLIIYLLYKTHFIKKNQAIIIYLIGLILSGIFLYDSPLFRRFLFGFYVIITIFVFQRVKNHIPIKPKNFYIALILFAISYGIWLLDYYKIFCNPESIIQGHGIWHTIDSIVIYYIYLFIKENFLV